MGGGAICVPSGVTVESGRHLVVNEEPTAPGALLLASWSRSRDVYSPLN